MIEFRLWECEISSSDQFQKTRNFQVGSINRKAVYFFRLSQGTVFQCTFLPVQTVAVFILTPLSTKFGIRKLCASVKSRIPGRFTFWVSVHFLCFIFKINFIPNIYADSRQKIVEMNYYYQEIDPRL